MFDLQKPTVQLLGRWQPWHDGHLSLFKEAVKITGQVCIQIRIMPQSAQNPFRPEEVYDRILQSLQSEGYALNENFIILQVPNIVNIVYGRDVGYALTHIDLPEHIKAISATEIRNTLHTGDSM